MPIILYIVVKNKTRPRILIFSTKDGLERTKIRFSQKSDLGRKRENKASMTHRHIPIYLSSPWKAENIAR